MKSSACKHDEHDLCSPNGRVRLKHGKVIGCDCQCHPKDEVQPKDIEEDDDAR